jgi:ABC-type multidrug transport system fused ATPase/permease subunit
MRACDDACATEFNSEKEGGLDFEAAQNGSNLSGGQRQRLNAARAFARNAGIVILDDASSALDNATDKKLRRAVKNMAQKPTTVIISQRCGSVRKADLIMVLEDGVCVGLGKHDELLLSCDTYKEINALQYGKEEDDK